MPPVGVQGAMRIPKVVIVVAGKVPSVMMELRRTTMTYTALTVVAAALTMATSAATVADGD